MEFQVFLRQQLDRHPGMQTRDVIKLCYQAAFGAEHILQDKAAAEAYFYKEYEETPATDEPLFEAISPEVCRVNFGGWKREKLPPQWLFRMFVHSEYRAEESRFLAYLQAALPLAEREAYLAGGIRPVHHSDSYREANYPHYRIVSSRFAALLPVLQRIKGKASGVIALDGRAAAGKSTMAGLLAKVLDAPVIAMDDFFLPLALRTPQRLAEVGGNVHYERFVEEVLPGLKSGEGFSYRAFDCGTMAYGATVGILKATYRIVEGSYSHHPALGDYADLRVFLDIDPETQMARIQKRNGECLAEMFRTRWIPMEEAYFDSFSIREKADLRL